MDAKNFPGRTAACGDRDVASRRAELSSPPSACTCGLCECEIVKLLQVLHGARLPMHGTPLHFASALIIVSGLLKRWLWRARGRSREHHSCCQCHLRSHRHRRGSRLARATTGTPSQSIHEQATVVMCLSAADHSLSAPWVVSGAPGMGMLGCRHYCHCFHRGE